MSRTTKRPTSTIESDARDSVPGRSGLTFSLLCRRCQRGVLPATGVLCRCVEGNMQIGRLSASPKTVSFLELLGFDTSTVD